MAVISPRCIENGVIPLLPINGCSCLFHEAVDLSDCGFELSALLCLKGDRLSVFVRGFKVSVRLLPSCSGRVDRIIYSILVRHTYAVSDFIYSRYSFICVGRNNRFKLCG